ncbi:MAG: CRISPR-associated endonuclease Cas6 [Chlorobi bacterium]|nr:CRISPR-associated endonuclease Cas6 [Chlorobiota bacterium]
MQLRQTIIRFPEIELHTRDAHKLRGYFGNVFKEHSPLLHNHFEDGKNRYAYPLVQYKVINKCPVLIGLGDGAKLLIDLFLKIKHIDIDGKELIVNSKNIENKIMGLDGWEGLYEYRFETLWMALNESNYRKYLSAGTTEKENLLTAILTGNILSFYKGVGFWTVEKILVKPKLRAKSTKFKGQDMVAFAGTFTSNAKLPGLVGLGKSVSRGFGAIIQI